MVKDRVPYFASNITGLTSAWYGYCDRGPDGKWRLKPPAPNHEPERFDREWQWWCCVTSRGGAAGQRMSPESKWAITKPEDMLTPFLWDAAAGKWDLTKPNLGWGAILGQMAVDANSFDEVFSYCLGDGCQFVQQGNLTPEQDAMLSPWRWNVQGITHFFQSIELMIQYVNRVAAILAGTDHTIRLGNELEVGAYGQFMNLQTYPEPFAWAKAVLEHLTTKLGYAWNRIYAGFCSGCFTENTWGGWFKYWEPQWFGEDALYATVREFHQIGKPEAIDKVIAALGWTPVKHPIRIAASPDGDPDSIKGDPAFYVSVLNKMFDDNPGDVAGANKYELEFFPPDSMLGDEAKLTEVLSAMAEVVKARTGDYPENYQKYEKPPIRVTPQIEKPLSCWALHMKNQPEGKLDIRRWLSCIWKNFWKKL